MKSLGVSLLILGLAISLLYYGKIFYDIQQAPIRITDYEFISNSILLLHTESTVFSYLHNIYEISTIPLLVSMPTCFLGATLILYHSIKQNASAKPEAVGRGQFE